MRRIIPVLALAALLAACAPSRPPAAPGADAYFRRPSPRTLQTIFSPLDLPAPNSMRLASGAPGPDYWQQRADYVIEAKLDAEHRTVEGTARVTYTNNSPHPLPFIWVHLEQNLFRQDSLGAAITPPGARFGNRDAFQGGFEIRYFRAASEPSMSTNGAEAAGVDLTYSVYDTLARVDLAQPIAPKGGRFIFDIAWSFRIPEYGSDRMGIEEVDQGTIFEIAQWFPAVAVYDDVHGWNTFPYLGQGEFYTNFGEYDVRLTVPRDHIVASTGVLQNPADVLTPDQLERFEAARSGNVVVVIRPVHEIGNPGHRPEGEGPLTWHFIAQNVRTFAWASSDAFIWDGCTLATSGPEGPDGKPTGTFVQSFYPAEAAREGEEPGQWTKSSDMLAFAIDGYSRRWFRYPYPAASNISGIVGGMEYPMIIFCGDRFDERGLYGVTTHEIGHNWFPMVVSTDERRHAWMDEGFDTFINYYSTRERYPEADGGRGDGRSFVDAMLLPDQQPMETPADHVLRHRLGNLEYAKTATALVLLREQVLGPDRFDAAFRAYINRWAFKSPRPADFFRTMEDVGGMDLAWFWRGWFLETGTLDQEVTAVESPEAGEVRVTFTNNGDLVMPVVFDVTYADGSTLRRTLPAEVWHTTNRWTTAWITGLGVTKVVVDPDEVFPDTDPSNNVWPR